MHKLGFMHLLTPVFPFRLGKTLCQEPAVRLHSGEHHSDLYAALQAGSCQIMNAGIFLMASLL